MTTIGGMDLSAAQLPPLCVVASLKVPAQEFRKNQKSSSSSLICGETETIKTFQKKLVTKCRDAADNKGVDVMSFRRN